MLAKHTPGPWIVELGGKPYSVWGWRVRAPKRTASVASVNMANEGLAVCGIQPPPKGMEEQFYSPEELEANAKLIAAAPALAWALSRIIADLPSRRNWLDPAIEAQAKDALTKAGLL